MKDIRDLLKGPGPLGPENISFIHKTDKPIIFYYPDTGKPLFQLERLSGLIGKLNPEMLKAFRDEMQAVIDKYQEMATNQP